MLPKTGQLFIDWLLVQELRRLRQHVLLHYLVNHAFVLSRATCLPVLFVTRSIAASALGFAHFINAIIKQLKLTAAHRACPFKILARQSPS